MAEIMVRRLSAGDAGALSRLLQAQRPEYLKDFHPFGFDEASLAATLRAAQRDRYWAIERDDALEGFFMLRGFDAGYERPSFGVFVAERARGAGLARLAVAHAQAWCATNGVAAIMLKVDQANQAARNVYVRAGFAPQGTCPTTGHLIHEWRSRNA